MAGACKHAQYLRYDYEQRAQVQPEGQSVNTETYRVAWGGETIRI